MIAQGVLREFAAVVRPLSLVTLMVSSGCVCSRRGGGQPGAAVAGGAIPSGAALAVYVSPNGADTNPGSADAPYATLVKARDALRARRAADDAAAGPLVVVLQEGTYRVAETFALGAEDSGTPESPTVWMAAPGETVRLVGGVRVDRWSPVTDDAVRSRLDPAARDAIRVSDLSALGVTDYGTVKPGTERAEVFFNGRYLTLARYPNEGFVRIADVPEEAKKARPVRDPKRPDLHRHAGPFIYSGDRPEQWASTENVWVHGYWFHDWSDQMHEVETFDFEKKELWPKPPYHSYGYKEGQRYYYLNVLEELDQPGEWFLDRDTGRLYLWPPAPVEDADVFFPELGERIVTVEGAQHVSLRGIVFESCRAGAVLLKDCSHCDVTGCLVRNVGAPAIQVQGGARNTVRSCDVHDVAATGVDIAGGDRKTLSPAGHAVENCHIHHFARVEKTYQPGVRIDGVGNRVSHCFIHDCPHAGIIYGGNDHTIEYTEFTRVARETGDVGAIYAAMDWASMGHVFRYNSFHHIHGPGKLGCFTVYPDLPCGGIHLYGNVFHDVDQVFHTNSGRGMLIENNLFIGHRYGINFSAWGDMKKFLPGGNWRMVERIEEVNYDQPPYSTRYPALAHLAEDFAKGEEHVRERSIPKDNVVRGNISAGESWFVRLRPAHVSLEHVKVENNLIADPVPFSGSPTGDGRAKSYDNDDPETRRILGSAGNIVTDAPPRVVDPEGGDYRVIEDDRVRAIGFEQIPFAKIGVHRDAYRNALPAALPKSPPAPVLNPDGGFFSGPVEVRVSLPRDAGDASIHYTLDRSTPSRESSVLDGPIRLTESGTITCAAFPPAGQDVDPSPMVSARYTISGRLEDGVYLSDLPLAEDYVGYQPMGMLRDVAYANRTLHLGGKEYPKGLITHPAQLEDGNRAVAEFALTGPLRRAERFTATIGIEDQAPRDNPNHGTCAFAVEVRRNGAWERAFESPTLRAGDKPMAVDVDLRGAERLRLIVTDAGDGIGWDHAVWAEPMLR